MRNTISLKIGVVFVSFLFSFSLQLTVSLIKSEIISTICYRSILFSSLWCLGRPLDLVVCH